MEWNRSALATPPALAIFLDTWRNLGEPLSLDLNRDPSPPRPEVVQAPPSCTSGPDPLAPLAPLAPLPISFHESPRLQGIPDFVCCAYSQYNKTPGITGPGPGCGVWTASNPSLPWSEERSGTETQASLIVIPCGRKIAPPLTSSCYVFCCPKTSLPNPLPSSFEQNTTTSHPTKIAPSTHHVWHSRLHQERSSA